MHFGYDGSTQCVAIEMLSISCYFVACVCSGIDKWETVNGECFALRVSG